MVDSDRDADVELAVGTLRLAIDAVEDCLDSLEVNDQQIAYDAALKLARQLTERVRRLRYKLRA